jgi:hypothetical protein
VINNLLATLPTASQLSCANKRLQFMLAITWRSVELRYRAAATKLHNPGT